MKATRTFAILVSVFFFWGFVAASNDILIPVFKAALNLEQWQSQMISFAFYVSYTLGSVGYLVISQLMRRDLLIAIGYGRGIAIGLLISAAGSLLFIPAANAASFPMLLGGLIVVGLGFSLQQTAANPMVIRSGLPETGSQRLSLAGGVNNLGTTIGPFLLTAFIFGSMNTSTGTRVDVAAVKLPYLALGAAFILFAVIFWFSGMSAESTQTPAAAETGDTKGVLRYRQLWMGMIAIFLYVGVEVSTAGNLSEYLKVHMHLETREAAPYISLFWASLMIGRWAAAAGSLNIGPIQRQLLRIALPFAAFAVYLAVSRAAQHDVSHLYAYAGMVVVLIAADFVSRGNPARQLFIYSICGIAALVTGIVSGGMVAAIAFVSVGLFCSTLWPCIFTLAIEGLGDKQAKGSNFLIMMIMGGGFISVLQGKLASPGLLGILGSYWVGVGCFAYLAYYALTMMRLRRSP